MEDCRDVLDDDLTIRLIEAAAYAGAYASLAKAMPESAGGFLKLARKQSNRVAALADELIRETERAASPLRGNPLAGAKWDVTPRHVIGRQASANDR